MYLQSLDIRCCRCTFLDQCICNLLFFELADAFQPVYHIQLHLHLAFSITWGYSPQKFCILNPLFLHLADTSRRNFVSSTCPFYTLQIHPTEFLHPHFQKIHYRRYLSHNILCVLFTSQLEPIHYLQKNWYKKFERIWNGRWWHLERKLLR